MSLNLGNTRFSVDDQRVNRAIKINRTIKTLRGAAPYSVGEEK